MKSMKSPLLASVCSILAVSEMFVLPGIYASPRAGDPKQPVESASQSVEQELEAARKAVLEDRPYKLNFQGIQEVVSLDVLPSSLSSDALVPDWWSEKQRYDLARLYAIALRYYPIFKVNDPESWDSKVLSREGLAPKPSDVSVSPADRRAQLRAVGLNNVRKQTRFDVDLYSFQHLPVKRKGIGIGFIAITNKQCSTETFLRSSVQLLSTTSEITPKGTTSSGIADVLNSDHETLVLNRMVVNKTGGTSLNLNFLVGGAGGGNFDAPAKPLKQIILDSIVDAAEAASCMASSNQACLDYYKNRPRLQPTKLTEKQKKKVESC